MRENWGKMSLKSKVKKALRRVKVTGKRKKEKKMMMIRIR